MGKGGGSPWSIGLLCFGYIWRCSIEAFLVFHTSGGISSSPSAFLFLIFLSTMLSFSCVNCSSLMSSGLPMILVIGSSVTLGDFPSKFLKCCFHGCIHSSWLAAFSFTLAVLFLRLASFIVCHAILDCLSYWSGLEYILFVLLGMCYLVHFVLF